MLDILNAIISSKLAYHAHLMDRLNNPKTAQKRTEKYCKHLYRVMDRKKMEEKNQSNIIDQYHYCLFVPKKKKK